MICITQNEKDRGEISKAGGPYDNIFEVYKENNSNVPSNSKENDNFDENDIINNHIKNDNNYINDNENNDNSKNLKSTKYSNYSERIIELINNIRQEPASYAEIIEDSIKYIIVDNNKDDPTKNCIIYKHKIKVALNRGKEDFLEGAEILRNKDLLPP